MAGASTIVIAREDLSIPGAEDDAALASRRQADIERAFFDLVRNQRPDVIVLDCRGTARNGVSAIQKIRQRVDTAILVVCAAHDPLERDYRIAGASDCLESPFDILQLNRTIQNIIRLTGPVMARPSWQAQTFEVAGLVFQPRQNVLSGNGSSIKLTTAENHLLLHLLMRPWTVCSRVEIAEILYGPHRPTSDRAIDVVVTRLRKKLAALRGPAADNLIKTEFRLGYMFIGDVSTAPVLSAPEAAAPC